jgi:hypothetical protein
MSTVVPSKEPEPISSRSVAERRSGAICQAALRTSAGNICSSVWLRTISMRSCSPLVGSRLGARTGIPTGVARCRAIGSRRRSSSRFQRSSLSGPSSAATEEDSWGSSCSPGFACDSGPPGGRRSRGWWNRPSGCSRAAKDTAARRRSVRSGARCTGARLLRGILITKGYRTVRRMVAQKLTGGAR